MLNEASSFIVNIEPRASIGEQLERRRCGEPYLGASVYISGSPSLAIQFATTLLLLLLLLLAFPSDAFNLFASVWKAELAGFVGSSFQRTADDAATTTFHLSIYPSVHLSII